MPANIAHMVIVHKAFELLRTKGVPDLAEFARMIDDPAQRRENDYWKYMNLGSVGPDLYCYASMARKGLRRADEEEDGQDPLQGPAGHSLRNSRALTALRQ